MPNAPEFLSDDVFRIGTTRFYFKHPLTEVPPGHLGIEKVRALLEAYFDLWEAFRPRHVVELGIRRGGSTAMLCELGVDRIVSIELAESRVEALDRYIADRGAEAVVRPWYGVNQADRERLDTIVAEELAGEPIDLVIDDASHRYHESRASFEVLFPRLRPGGLYLLEDWRSQHMLAAGIAAATEADANVRREIERCMVAENWSGPQTPMSRLVLELVIARAISGEVVADIEIGPDWAAVRRGPAALVPGEFRLDEVATDHLSVLAPIR